MMCAIIRDGHALHASESQCNSVYSVEQFGTLRKRILLRASLHLPAGRVQLFDLAHYPLDSHPASSRVARRFLDFFTSSWLFLGFFSTLLTSIDQLHRAVVWKTVSRSIKIHFCSTGRNYLQSRSRANQNITSIFGPVFERFSGDQQKMRKQFLPPSGDTQ